ncbi:PepSY-associated TM helix domain-containing protein [Sphingomonas paucimobilis]|uniref:PepSY-associated TM helix domain-containing protein n=1 Tax=Sphingomonas paucimobilis TaxID=13689 RepID=UPI0028D85B68|nr:PepSY-associated TM helix domain-containing protein [Sphingomonas paucimobilis]
MAGITLRDSGLQIHRWLGLAVGLLAIALALSGAVLACAPLIDRIAAPARYRVSGETRLAASAYAEAAYRRLRPGERIAALSMERGSAPVIVTLDRASDRARRLLFLDPPTAQMLASARADGGMIGVVRRLHQGLFLSGIGRWIIAVGGIAVLLASLTGLWAQLFRQRPKPSAKRLAKDARSALWHQRIALWSAIPVLAMTATGTILAFSDTMATVPSARPVTRPALPVQRVVASARTWSRGTTLTVIDWPTERSADWTLHFAGSQPATIKVADDTAGALSAPALAAPVALSWMGRLHEGQGMPWVWAPLAVLTGLLSAWTAATGLVAWARRPKFRPARRSADRRRRGPAA